MIKIEEIQTEKNKMFARVDVSNDLKKYFLEDFFYAEYDFILDDISPSILYVPIINNLIHVAWATGSDVQVLSIEKSHLLSCQKIKEVFRDWYPNLSFDSEIIADNIVETKIGCSNMLQLYSGGIDTTATLIRNKKKQPSLIIVDLEPAGIHPEIIEHAKKEPGGGHLVRSNLYSFLNRRQLDTDFGDNIEGSWWGGLQHGMGLLGVTAPITIYNKANTVSIAATHDETMKIPWGSDPRIDNLVAWADVSCYHDGYEFSRQNKIKKIIKSDIEQTGQHPLLMVCNSYSRERGQYNCSKCAKCAQAIIGLLVEGIDPRECGFDLTEKTLAWIKESLDTMVFFARKSDYWTWKDTHDSIPDDLEGVVEYVPGTQEFLNWFKGLDLKYEDYFNNICVMRDRPMYSLAINNGVPELMS